MYELLFSSQQPKAKDFRRHCCNVLFLHVRLRLTEKIKEDHQQAIEEKDAAFALITDNFQGRDNQIQAIHYQNVGLQGEIRAKNLQIATF